MIICYNLFSLHVCVEETRRLGRNMIVHLRQFEVVHWWPTASLSGIHLHKTHQHHLNSGRRTRNGEPSTVWKTFKSWFFVQSTSKERGRHIYPMLIGWLAKLLIRRTAGGCYEGSQHCFINLLFASLADSCTGADDYDHYCILCICF